MAKEYKVDYYSIIGFVGFALLTVFIWRFYYGYYILYPFTLLGTWFHEMGHGIMAMIVGGNFEYLEIFETGSGVAHSSFSSDDFYMSKKVSYALVSAAGLMGPPIMGSILILMSKSFKKSKVILFILSISMILSVMIWVRITLGVVAISSLGLILLFIAFKGGKIFQQFVVQLIGIMACVSTYRQLDYLFMEKAVINGEEFISDTGKIAENLGMNYAFWGTLIAIISFVMLVYSLYLRNRTLVS